MSSYSGEASVSGMLQERLLGRDSVDHYHRWEGCMLLHAWHCCMCKRLQVLS